MSSVFTSVKPLPVFLYSFPLSSQVLLTMEVQDIAQMLVLLLLLGGHPARTRATTSGYGTGRGLLA